MGAGKQAEAEEERQAEILREALETQSKSSSSIPSVLREDDDVVPLRGGRRDRSPAQRQCRLRRPELDRSCEATSRQKYA